MLREIIIGVITILISYFLIFNWNSISNIILDVKGKIGDVTIEDSETLKKCKESVREKAENTKLSSPIDASYSFMKILFFEDKKSAEDFADEVTFLPNNNICGDPDLNITAVLYEFRYGENVYGVKKETIAYFCDENGTLLKKSSFC